MESIIPQDDTPEKYCPRCKQPKRISEFGKDKRKPDGLRNVCKKCRHDEYERQLARTPDMHKQRYQRFLQRPESIERMKVLAKPRRKRYYAKAREQGICPNCNAPCAASKVFCDDCQSKINALNALNRAKLRDEVLQAYGCKCQCCGETTPEFLAIDHIYNDGKEHRKTVSSGLSMYTWLKKQGFPQDRYQLLCQNCNWGKRLYGICPHKKSLHDHLP